MAIKSHELITKFIDYTQSHLKQASLDNKNWQIFHSVVILKTLDCAVQNK